MVDATVQSIFDQTQATGVMSRAEFDALRRAIGADLTISQAEADLLFKLNDTIQTPDGWSDYFLTAITTFLVYQTPPEGYISDINAAWLLSRIKHDGVVETETELGLLLHTMKLAHNVTESLERFALNQVKEAVLNGKGHLARQSKLQPGVIGEAEVDMLRKVIYAVSSEGGISVTRREAEILFDLNEATSGKPNCDSWQKLFVGAIANHLMMSAAWDEAPYSEALRRHDWFNSDSREGVESFFSNPMKFAKAALKDLIGMDNMVKDYTHMDIAKVQEAEKVTSLEADWLIERLNRDGGIDDNERALLDFLAEECPSIHASLKPLIRAA